MTSNTHGRAMNACTVHSFENLELKLPLEFYLRAFPRRRGNFITVRRDVVLIGADPAASFRAFRTDASVEVARDRQAPHAKACRVVTHVRRAFGTTSTLAAFAPNAIDGSEVLDDVSDSANRASFLTADPLEALAQFIAQYNTSSDVVPDSPLPMVGGAFGYVGYEINQCLEPLESATRPSLGWPDIAFFLYDWVIGHQRESGNTYLCVVGQGETPSVAEQAARSIIERVTSHLRWFESVAHTPLVPCASGKASATSVGPLTPLLDAPSVSVPIDTLLAQSGATLRTKPNDYRDAIAQAQAHIRAGDAFELCLTHRIEASFEGDALALWDTLRHLSPAPMATFFEFEEGAVVSSSPERFVSLDASGVVESSPIKGTRPRGSTPESDRALAFDLAHCIKDRAENAMIVDLVRNDLGRICNYGSVHVPELYGVHTFAKVHQLISTVRGKLRDGLTAVDVIRACFPPGSMTGAPKIEAMNILQRLEPVERGVYAGGLGWIDLRGTMDLSVVIRTLVIDATAPRGAPNAFIHVGGAIVADSQPEAEYEETRTKARAMLEALALMGAHLETQKRASDSSFIETGTRHDDACYR